MKQVNSYHTRETDPAIAALIEPFACVLRGQDVLDIRAGEVVLVGPIGLMQLWQIMS